MPCPGSLCACADLFDAPLLPLLPLLGIPDGRIVEDLKAFFVDSTYPEAGAGAHTEDSSSGRGGKASRAGPALATSPYAVHLQHKYLPHTALRTEKSNPAEHTVEDAELGRSFPLPEKLSTVFPEGWVLFATNKAN